MKIQNGICKWCSRIMVPLYSKDFCAVEGVSRLQENLIRNISTANQHVGFTGAPLPVKVIDISQNKYFQSVRPSLST